MLWLIPYLILAQAQEPPSPEQHPPTEDVGDCKDSITDLKNRMLGLEFFLQDKKDYKEHCPQIEWEQPKLEVYKKDPKSHLPEGCKPEDDS